MASQQTLTNSLQQQQQWGELAPYLAGLNVSEALEDFGRLADRVLSQPAHSVELAHHQVAPPAEPTLDPDQQQWALYRAGDRNSIYSSSSPSSSSSSVNSLADLDSAPCSPGSVSLYSSATQTSSSSLSSHCWQFAASSPLASEHSFSASSSAFSSPSRLNSSSSSSSASSLCGDLDERSQHATGRLSRKSASPIGKRTDRKRQNASAAGRYRQRQRGRLCSLDEELELERERNVRLMRSFEAKLELYREFANLLASNTRDPGQDLELARLGFSSIENILQRICPAQFLAKNESQRNELERLLSHFQRVLNVAHYQR